jgi:hypothetical protein
MALRRAGPIFWPESLRFYHHNGTPLPFSTVPTKRSLFLTLKWRETNLYFASGVRKAIIPMGRYVCLRVLQPTAGSVTRVLIAIFIVLSFLSTPQSVSALSNQNQASCGGASTTGISWALDNYARGGFTGDVVENICDTFYISSWTQCVDGTSAWLQGAGWYAGPVLLYNFKCGITAYIVQSNHQGCSSGCGSTFGTYIQAPGP